MEITHNLPINQQYYLMLEKENFLKELCNLYITEFQYGDTLEAEVSDFEKEVAQSVYKTIKSSGDGLTFIQTLINAFVSNLTFVKFKHILTNVTFVFE